MCSGIYIVGSICGISKTYFLNHFDNSEYIYFFKIIIIIIILKKITFTYNEIFTRIFELLYVTARFTQYKDTHQFTL